MNKLKIFALSALAILGLASCQPDPETPAPEIKLGQTAVSLLAEGATESIAYLVENPVEGEKIAVACEADWLTVDSSKVRTLSFTAPINNTGEVRSAEVTISYKGAESVVVNVSQGKLDNPLSIEITEVTATEVVFSVTSTNPDLTWLPAVVSKEYDDYYTDEQMVETDIEYLIYTAENQGMTLENLLEMVLAKGNLEDVYFGNLDPETDYVLYVYGLSLDAQRTTELVKVEFTTEKAWEGDITVEFEVREENHVLSFDAIPSHTGVPYYCHYATEDEIERWKETYGTDDLKTLIEKGSIGEMLAGLIEIGYFSGPEDFFMFFNADGKIMDNYFPCKASTKYVIFAAKWNEKCELVGEVSTCEYTTAPVEPSDNQITLSVDDITQSTATVTATVTNDDPYTIYPVESSLLEGKTTEEIVDYMEAHYFLSEFTYSGNKTQKYTSLKSDTEYTFVAFGYLAKTISTADITTYTFRTLPSSDPSNCTFDFEYQVYEESVWAKVTPSDKGHWYYWGVFDARFTENDVKTYISDILIGESYEGDAYVFASWWLKKGDQTEEVGGLLPSTEYRIAAVVMDYNTGEFLTDVTFSEVFKTPEPVYAEIEFKVNLGKYYDIDELAAAGYTQYKDAANEESWKYENGGAVISSKMNISGSYSKYFYYLVRYDLTDTEKYNDSIFLKDMIDRGLGSTSPETLFLMGYDFDYTLCAVAIDVNGNYTPVYREKVRITKSGKSPVSDFIASQEKVAPLKVSTVDWTNYDLRSVGTRIPTLNPVVESVDIQQLNLEGRNKALKAMCKKQ